MDFLTEHVATSFTTISTRSLSMCFISPTHGVNFRKGYPSRKNSPLPPAVCKSGDIGDDYYRIRINRRYLIGSSILKSKVLGQWSFCREKIFLRLLTTPWLPEAWPQRSTPQYHCPATHWENSNSVSRPFSVRQFPFQCLLSLSGTILVSVQGLFQHKRHSKDFAGWIL